MIMYRACARRRQPRRTREINLNEDRNIPRHRSADILYGSRILPCEILNPEDRSLLLLVPDFQDIPDFFTLHMASDNAEHLARIVCR
jgi:hypothetical protein